MVSALLGSGLEGISKSRDGLTQSAKTIASGGQTPPVNDTSAVKSEDDAMLTAVVDLKLYEVQFKASAKVISTADEVAGTLIDEMA
ncbi:flagellar biosynthesis protein FlgE [Litoribrevibacter euphylliae]|uniref:Flagellar biosynthesis protein FlgE n=1 Tax=Litoribrevibacter euphylliae TaxID=1834034 RepID=A0ABV7HPC8_9GAMM